MFWSNLVRYLTSGRTAAAWQVFPPKGGHTGHLQFRVDHVLWPHDIQKSIFLQRIILRSIKCWWPSASVDSSTLNNSNLGSWECPLALVSSSGLGASCFSEAALPLCMAAALRWVDILDCKSQVKKPTIFDWYDWGFCAEFPSCVKH